MSTSDQAWADYWQHDGDGGEVFVNAKGERHPSLAKYWDDVFDQVPDGARVIDLASGAGSIFAHLPSDHGFRLHAADIAADALASLEARIPGVQTTVCSADDVPFADGSFDVVVSQFGVEYAGIDAFTEAARLLAPEGQLAILCHVEDGYIDSGNKAQLHEARYIQESGFIDLCLAVTRAGFSSDQAAIQSSEAAFLPVASNIVVGIKRCPRGIHSHLFNGFRQLFDDRRSYDEEDISVWLEQMRTELVKNIDRLTRMRMAASSEADARTISKNLMSAGLQDIQFDVFITPGNALPVAWNLSAKRPA